MQSRQMDQLLAVEKYIGEIAGVITLGKETKSAEYRQDDYEKEKFPEPEIVLVKPRVIEGDDEAPEEPPAEETTKKVNSFRPEMFEWTITNGIPKTLPMLYRLFKGQKNVKNETERFSEFTAEYIEQNRSNMGEIQYESY